jgi:flagellar basal-body rod protein FlgF
VTSSISQMSANIDALEKEFDSIAHNMANVSTVGFKRRSNNFTKAMVAQGGGPESGADDGAPQGAFDFSQGTLVQTDRTLDVALYGKGFFVLESPEGPLYTRHGIFLTNPNGQIVDSAGRLVSGASGPLLVPPNVDVSEIRVDDAGRVTAGPALLGQFRIVEFADKENRLFAVGSSCFAAPKDVPPKDAANVAVRQGYEEASNVKLVDELVSMITVSRLYEANMKLTTVNKDNTSSAISVAMG